MALFIARDLFKIADLLEVPDIRIMELVCNQRAADKAAKKSAAIKKRGRRK